MPGLADGNRAKEVQMFKKVNYSAEQFKWVQYSVMMCIKVQ